MIVLYVAVHMMWDGAREVVVRTGHAEEYNAMAPGFLDIKPHELERHER